MDPVTPDKGEILGQISDMAEKEILTRAEVVQAFEAGRLRNAPGGSSVSAVGAEPRLGVQHSQPAKKRIGVAEILFYIGGAVVFLGLAFMVGQNWKTLGAAPRLLLTLGAGIAAYYAGLALSRDEKTEMASPAFFLISALIMPVGLYVVFDSAGVKVSGYGYQVIISGIMLGVYLTSYYVFRRSLFVLFSILFGTWLFFSITSFLIMQGPQFDLEKFYLYRVVAAGLAYLLLGHAFGNGKHAPIAGFLNNAGLIAFLGAALILGGWEPSQNVFWEVFYPGFVFAALFLSVSLRSTAYLVWGAIFLIAYLTKITMEYFSKSMGWPAALIFAGLMLIGVAYLTVSLRRRYF